MIFIARVEVEALVERKKERFSSAATCTNFKPPYPAMIAAKPYPFGYIIRSSKSLTDAKAVLMNMWFASMTPWALSSIMQNYVFGSLQSY